MKPESCHIPYLLVALMGIAMSLLSHAADNVAINFTDTIRAATCDVTSEANQTVLLVDTSTTYFGNPGDVSPATSSAVTSLAVGANATVQFTLNYL